MTTIRTKALLRLGAGALTLAALATWIATGQAPKGEPAEQKTEAHDDSLVRLTPEQAQAAGITTATAGPGRLVRRVRVTATVTADQDHIVHIAPRIAGVVADARKRLGDAVTAGEVLALIDSTEVADARAEYLAARENEHLARTTADREEALWRQRISPERDYLQAKAAAMEAAIRTGRAHHSLQALGLDETSAKSTGAKSTGAGLQRLELRSPIAGQVIARTATRGDRLAADADAYVVADLSQLSLTFPVYARDLPFVAVGKALQVSGADGRATTARVTHVGPVLDPATGSAPVVATLDNPDGSWRPGDFATGTLEADAQEAAVLLPESAVVTLDGQTQVFAPVPGGYARRPVTLGRGDGTQVEVLAGLKPGDTVAAGNAFILKAEAGKGDAGHDE
ncbi:efflux RND transporter periplasmic adaptor subunit [Nitrospirillum sp. BR 11828]|uniref:efflux RND transporter periplasmic adaptor subunit n=1 Tax=Nitrospirillum sp. BR 11828 TaxID=3104325 RepID=UPI002ACAB699|nr:efflux RND transporter periplasmic adaptor subunit [Nitrospirillum sp. BR 11828]MDZ5645815.1 efflux RND transporter periplasmic adaptor subunit [Nitrospirillum sp. BR 11828]